MQSTTERPSVRHEHEDLPKLQSTRARVVKLLLYLRPGDRDLLREALKTEASFLLAQLYCTFCLSMLHCDGCRGVVRDSELRFCFGSDHRNDLEMVHQWRGVPDHDLPPCMRLMPNFGQLLARQAASNHLPSPALHQSLSGSNLPSRRRPTLVLTLSRLIPNRTW